MSNVPLSYLLRKKLSHMQTLMSMHHALLSEAISFGSVLILQLLWVSMYFHHVFFFFFFKGNKIKVLVNPMIVKSSLSAVIDY